MDRRDELNVQDDLPASISLQGEWSRTGVMRRDSCHESSSHRALQLLHPITNAEKGCARYVRICTTVSDTLILKNHRTPRLSTRCIVGPNKF
ncbi:unnamed protein product [Mycena citricolor]|uniref:Uncharacterized protein n=1 Tax=Mycena citricolor TaxID=2018698 RepID=A0AAD2H0K0_9AGAR|nr:unnamed protein product [Mycena citricolor]